MKIINLTTNPPLEGVDEPPHKDLIIQLNTFTEIPSFEEVARRAGHLTDMAQGYSSAWIGGEPYLTFLLIAMLVNKGITPICSFNHPTPNSGWVILGKKQ